MELFIELKPETMHETFDMLQFLLDFYYEYVSGLRQLIRFPI